MINSGNALAGAYAGDLRPVLCLFAMFHMYIIFPLLRTVLMYSLYGIYWIYYCNLTYLHKISIGYVARAEKKMNIQEDSMGNFQSPSPI